MNDEAPIYVGYLKTPPAHMRVVRVVVPMLIVVFALVGVLTANAFRDPGPATWNTGQALEWEGRLIHDPYPALITDDGATHLVVEIGKVSAHDRVDPHAGKRVTLAGYPLERDGRQMIELLEGDGAFVAIGGEAGDVFEPIVGSDAVDVVGEIVDGKCFLGAMKPGDGKSHKACAVLCIAGGLPPMVHTRGPDGSPVFALLMVDGDASLPRELWDIVGEPVRIEGTRGRVGDLDVIRCDGACITPFSDDP